MKRGNDRLWWVTYACGHEAEVWTVIGDCDYMALHKGAEEFCFMCRDEGNDPITKLVSAVVIAESLAT